MSPGTEDPSSTFLQLLGQTVLFSSYRFSTSWHVLNIKASRISASTLQGEGGPPPLSERKEGRWTRGRIEGGPWGAL